MSDPFRNANAFRFAALTIEERHARIRALASQGWGDHQIAALFALRVDLVREVLSEPPVRA
jgi:hypothetical protein